MLDGELNLQQQLGVWLLPLTEVADTSLAKGCERLTREERARFDAYASATRRREFALCRLLLRTVLERHGYTSLARATLSEGPHGKPKFSTRDAPAFNLSHALGMAVLVIGGHRSVGVDIEPANRQLSSELLAPRYCHAAELQWLAPYAPDTTSHRQHFLRLWVRKEAVLKARGDGVHGGPRRIDAVSIPGAATYHAEPDGAVQHWKITDIEAHDDYLVSVASTLDAPESVVELLKGPCAVL